MNKWVVVLHLAEFLGKIVTEFCDVIIKYLILVKIKNFQERVRKIEANSTKSSMNVYGGNSQRPFKGSYNNKRNLKLDEGHNSRVENPPKRNNRGYRNVGVEFKWGG